MRNNESEIYTLIDENFVNSFKPKHLEFMKSYYYKEYVRYCERIKVKEVSIDKFFTNMRRRKIKLIQLCCPYCGTVHVIATKDRMENANKFTYCWHCGKSSVSYNIFTRISSLARIRGIHMVGLETMKEMFPDKDTKILTYDVYHLELVQLTSILEVILRDFFEAFIQISYFNVKSKYISSVINKSTGNDFMNIEKANKHYKKALDIDLRTLIEKETWSDLLDLVNIRNTIIHNNGMIDERFKESRAYERIQDCISGELIFLSKEKNTQYMEQVISLATIVGNLFDERYKALRHGLIANYYFNSSLENFD